jgi:quinol monooxygenase YgiN
MKDNHTSSTGGSRPGPGGETLQFAHLLELKARPGRAKRAIEILRDHAIPTIIQPAEGFIDEIVLFSLDEPDHVTAISFWKDEEVSDRFDAYGFDQVSELLKDVLTETATRHPYNVGASTNPRIRGWSPAPIPNRAGRGTASTVSNSNPVGGASSIPGLNAIPNVAGNMIRGMVGLMNPLTMFREMAGIMTNPANIFTVGQRLLTGLVPQQMQEGGNLNRTPAPAPVPRPGSRAPVSRSGTAPILQFAHLIDLDTKPGRAREAVDIIGNQAIPTIIQPAEGFRDGIVMLSLSNPNHITAISFWEDKDISDRFDTYGFEKVNELLKDVLAVPVRRRKFYVGASTNPRILGWSQ